MRFDNRTTESWQQADIDHYLHPFTDYKGLAVEKARVMVRGQGCHVWDSDGNRYLDGLAGLACVHVGYARPELIDAAAAQMRELVFFNSFFKATNKPAVALAEKLVEIAPRHMRHVFYVNSGSEANDTAIRLVRHYWALEGKPEKSVVIGREFAYHGSTIASASLGGMPPMHAQAADLPGFAHIPTPYQFLTGRGLSEEAYGVLAASWLEDKIREVGPERVAAFFLECVHGAGGGKFAPRNYFAEVQRICSKYDVLLVDDEVVCGFGRTGDWFGAHTYGLRPDLLCFAKGVTSGYVPLGGVLVGDRIARTLIDKGGEFYHGFTYSGHPTTCAVALANLEVIEREGLVRRVHDDTGPYFARMLASLADHTLVGEVRSVGLLAGVELVRDRATLEPLQPEGLIGERFRDLGLRHGLITRPVGETLLLAPPLVITHAEIDFMGQALRRALDDFQGEIEHGTVPGIPH
jgi:putrescine aminotransferase